MVELIFDEIDSFANFHFQIQAWPEGEEYCCCIHFFGDGWHMYKEFTWKGLTQEETIKRCKDIMGKIRQIRILCGLQKKDETI